MQNFYLVYNFCSIQKREREKHHRKSREKTAHDGIAECLYMYIQKTNRNKMNKKSCAHRWWTEFFIVCRGKKFARANEQTKVRVCKNFFSLRPCCLCTLYFHWIKLKYRFRLHYFLSLLVWNFAFLFVALSVRSNWKCFCHRYVIYSFHFSWLCSLLHHYHRFDGAVAIATSTWLLCVTLYAVYIQLYISIIRFLPETLW